MPAQGSAQVTRRACTQCGELVDTFKDDLGCRRQIEIRRVPARLDVAAPAYRDRLWERSEYFTVGWRLKTIPVRTWRELRLEHACRPAEKE